MFYQSDLRPTFHHSRHPTRKTEIIFSLKNPIKTHINMCVVNYFLFHYKMFKYILRKRKEQEKHDRVPLLNDNEDDDNSQYNAIE